jgi:outer membrane biogenesis lipoprotein LolB
MSMLRRAALLWAPLTLVLLSGCVTAPPVLPQLATAPRAFETTGRIAVRQADRSDIAKVRWTHRGQADTWILSSPLGNEVARIESSGGDARMQANGQEVVAPSFEALTQRVLGVALDPARLAAWLHAQGAGDDASGWHVAIEETQDAGAVKLARRIVATRGDVTVRWVVDSYEALAD